MSLEKDLTEKRCQKVPVFSSQSWPYILLEPTDKEHIFLRSFHGIMPTHVNTCQHIGMRTATIRVLATTAVLQSRRPARMSCVASASLTYVSHFCGNSWKMSSARSALRVKLGHNWTTCCCTQQPGDKRPICTVCVSTRRCRTLEAGSALSACIYNMIVFSGRYSSSVYVVSRGVDRSAGTDARLRRCSCTCNLWVLNGQRSRLGM